MRGGKGYTDSLPTKNWGERTRSSAAERLIIEPAAVLHHAPAEGGNFAKNHMPAVLGSLSFVLMGFWGFGGLGVRQMFLYVSS